MMADQSQKIDLPLRLPQLVTPEWIAEAQAALLKSTWQGAGSLKKVLPKAVAIAILERAERLAQTEPTLLEVRIYFYIHAWRHTRMHRSSPIKYISYIP